MDILRRVYWLGLLLTYPMMFSCGNTDYGASVDGGNDSTGTGYTVSITDSYIDTVVDTSVINLYGTASCPECPPPQWASDHCPPISCPASTVVNVSWFNLTTGESGATYQGIHAFCGCTSITGCINQCEHNWSASVPITIGPNEITASASDPSSIYDSDSITITRLLPAPSNVETAAGHGLVTVSWSSVPDATSYNIYWSTSQSITTESATKITGVTTPYTLTGLSDNVTYYFLVTAVYGDYESFVSDVTWATVGWSTEAVAETLATTEQRATSIGMDSAGNAHIHYSYDEHLEPSGILSYNYYTTNETGIWTSVFVDNSSEVNASIALDSNDSIHIGYFDFPGLTHSIYTGGNWTQEVVDTQTWCNLSLALDATDKLHFAYRAHSDQSEELRYSTNTSGPWASTTFDAANLGCSLSGRRLSLAVDTTGIAHIAYAGDYPEYGLKYATNAGGVWSISTVDQGYIEQVSIAVDQNGAVHIVYSDNISQLRYAYNISGSWVVELLESRGSPSHPSIAVDASGRVHISYFHNQYGELRYTTNLSGVWQVIPIDYVGFTPTGSSTDTAIALDAQGKVYISYFRGNTLKFATNR